MNKIYLFSIIFGIWFTANSVLATVGGPTYISEIASNAVHSSIYYKVHDGGGRGCPPIIHKIDLATLKDTEVKTCTEIYNQPTSYYSEYGLGTYNQFMIDFYTDLQFIGSVSLKKNNIDVRVEFLSEHVVAEYDFVDYSDFQATVTQDGKEIGKINFRGCAKDQPHVFEGYIVPNSDKMIILISNKSDCFEGGYVRESLYVIKGVKYYDKNIVRGFKPISATEPNGGNLVVYAGAHESGITAPENTKTDTKNNKNILYIVVIVLGLGFGYFFGRKVRK